MPQQDVLNLGPGFWPYPDKTEHVRITPRGLERLYAFTDWRRLILLDERVNETYQSFSTINLFKALALPYLIPIPSERSLARELKERELLQTLCGFLPGQTPTRATLWHFRRKYSGTYPELMLRVLIAMVLSGNKPNLHLPFVAPIGETERPPDGSYSKFSLDLYRPGIDPLEIRVWTTISETENGPPIDTRGKTMIDLRHEIKERENRARQNAKKKSMSSGLKLPAEVETELAHTQVSFVIVQPTWMDSLAGSSDPLTTVGSSSLRPYAACHVLIIREEENRRQVLLSRRLAGYGSGTYMLPGGKQRPDESMQECASRELREETGMCLLDSKPISLHSTRLPGKPRVTSVGVLAVKHEGKPQRLEPHQNSQWEWFDLDNLPDPLFEPTRIVISHYVKQTYPGLEWSDVESVQELPKQLSFWNRKPYINGGISYYQVES
jgi:8-oxo-dGTP diphosphatase